MKKKKIQWKMIFAFLGYNLIFAAVLAPFIVFWGPFQSLKAMAVGSVYTSRHPQVVKAFLSQTEIDKIMDQTNSQVVSNESSITHFNSVNESSGITIEDIQGPNFKGKVMLIKDPKRVKLAITKQIGITGERVSDLVKDSGAIAGINAGGFYDPNGKGNGAFPDGLTVHNGILVHNNVANQTVNIVGFNDQGRLVI